MQPSRSLRILFPEGSSLSAREALSALGRQGYTIDVCDPNPWCVCRFSRFVRTSYRCPSWGTHPLAYLEFLVHLLKQGRYDVLLPVHEQAFLFARVREQLSQLVGVAVADFNTFALLQSKAAFVSLLDELGLPHPRTRLCHSRAELERPHPFPYYIKTAYGTAGSGVWRIDDAVTLAAVIDLLEARGLFNEPASILVQDVLSLIPLLIVFVQLLINPQFGKRIASQAISNYALTEETARLILHWNEHSRFDRSNF